MLNKKIISATLPAAALLILSAVFLGSKMGALAQNTSYPVATLTDSGDVNFLLQTQAIEFSGGKWTYNFTWKRTRDAEGRFVVAPATNEYSYVVDIDPATRERSSSNPLVVKLDPSTRYIVKYFAGPSSLCNESLGTSDPECAVIRSVYFNTRNENGRVMSVSEIPISRGGTSITADTTSTNTSTSGDQTIAVLQAQINQLLQIVQTLLARLGGNTTVANIPAGTNTNTPSTTTTNTNTTGPLTITTRPVPQDPYAGSPVGTQVVTAKVYTSNTQCKDFIICTNTGTAVCSNEQCPTVSQANTLANAKTMTVTIVNPPNNVCPTDTLRVCPNRTTAHGKVFAGGICTFSECENNSKITGIYGTCDPYPEVCPDGSLTYRNNKKSCQFDQCPASSPKTDNINSCISALGNQKFSPGTAISPAFTVSSSLAQEMKTWQRCHYAAGGAGFNHAGPDGKVVNTVSLADQRRYAQECADLFVSQAKRLGFDEATCSVGEYCGVGDGNPDSLCTANQQYWGRATSCSLSERGEKLFVGEASSVVGNDFGASSPHGEPQGWYQWLWYFNAQLARKTSGAWDVSYDAIKGVFRPNTATNLTSAPQACMGIVNVSVNTTSDRTGTVSWQAPSSVRNVSIYLLTRSEGNYRVPGHENELGVEATLAENIINGQGVNTFNFTIPPETSLPVPGQLNTASRLYGSITSGVMDQAVQRTQANFFVRVVADNGIFGDSKNIFLNGQVNTQAGSGDYGTKVNPPPAPTFTSTCEQALATLDFTKVGMPQVGWTGNSRCSTMTSTMVDVGLPVTTAWYPKNFPNANMVLRVAEDNGGKGEAAVRGGCANASECFLKIDQLWGTNVGYAQQDGDMAGGGIQVTGLKPGTKYWFRTAAVCNLGQANQTYKDEVWSCTTPTR